MKIIVNIVFVLVALLLFFKLEKLVIYTLVFVFAEFKFINFCKININFTFNIIENLIILKTIISFYSIFLILELNK